MPRETPGLGPGPPRDPIAAHVARNNLLRKLARVDNAPPKVGRFIVLERLGRGAHGVVYAAYDPQLDRRVALKLLVRDEPALRARLVREARALARLAHPNVVAVHEVGDTDGSVFVAMEYIAGTTLAQWLTTLPSPDQILDRLTEAGRGLAEAHAQGLVHRDFKPNNVMVGTDGGAKVTDFGLASLASIPGSDARDTNTRDPAAETTPDDLTQTGVVMGTPAYMAPEQHARMRAGPAADQYSFCLTAWEALAGRHPLARSGQPARLPSVVELEDLKRAGPSSWPAPGQVRRLVLDALRRGLTPDPAQRWPSMEALLSAMSPPTPGRRRGWALGIGVGALAIGGVTRYAMRPAERTCTGGPDQLAAVWNEARRTELEAAVLGTGVPYAVDVWNSTGRELDRYASAWLDTYHHSCQATVRGEQSTEVLDLRMGCLRRAARSLRATVETLADADAKTVENAHALTGALPTLARCSDSEALAAEVEPPLPEEEDAVEAARLELARALSLTNAGRYAAAHDALEQANASTAGVVYGPVHTELAHVEGRVLEKRGDFGASRAAFTRALELASQWEQRDLMRAAALNLMYSIGDRHKQPDHALHYWPLAAGLSHGEPELEAQARSIHAAVLSTAGRYEEAAGDYRTAISLLGKVADARPTAIANSRNGLAAALSQLGDYRQAESEIRAALSVFEAELGPDHPSVAVARSNLGALLGNQGRYPEAEVEHRAALAIKERVLRPNHPSVATSRGNLGAVLSEQHKYEDAERQHRASLSTRRQVLGPDHPLVAVSVSNLGTVLYRQRKFEEAEREHQSALALRREALGPRHPDIAVSHSNLAATLHAQGRHAQAEVEHRKALDIREEFAGPNGSDLAKSQTGLAAVLLDLERPDEALPLAERGWSALRRPTVPIDRRAWAAATLAHALWDAHGDGRDRHRAREVAEEALHSYRDAGEGFAEELGELQRWVDELVD